jgi:hypothetical protein
MPQLPPLAPTREKQSPLSVPGALPLIPAIGDADGSYQPIRGGIYDAKAENLNRLNKRYCLVDVGQDAVWYEDRGPQGLQIRIERAIKLALANVKFRVSQPERTNGLGRSKSIIKVGYEWFKGEIGRLPPATPVFKTDQPAGRLSNDEFNMWMGWGVQPDPNYTEDLQILLDHIRNVMCNNISQQAGYFLKWVMWGFQNPDKRAEAAPIFNEVFEGTGKNIILDMIVRSYGRHGVTISNPKDLLGDYATNEQAVFILLDEALFHGNKQAADLLKSILTGVTRIINPKFIAPYTITNRLKICALSNHDIVVAAGAGARRLVPIEVSREKAFQNDPAKDAENKTYFKCVGSAAQKAAGQFLHFCLNYKLNGWHPRDIVRTKALAEHQRAGMPPVYRWFSTCAELEETIGGSSRVNKTVSSIPQGYEYHVRDTNGNLTPKYSTSVPLEVYIPTAVLLQLYSGWARDNNIREVAGSRGFGKYIARILGVRHRLPSTSRPRAWGYFMPDANTLNSKINKEWGIK